MTVIEASDMLVKAAHDFTEKREHDNGKYSYDKFAYESGVVKTILFSALQKLTEEQLDSFVAEIHKGLGLI